LKSARQSAISAGRALRGTSISYTQTYRTHGGRAEFHGSIFGVMQNVQADGCELKIESALFDRYSGSIGKNLIGQTETKYITSVHFRLTQKMTENLKIVDARPVRQLAPDTNAVCFGVRQCNLTWLKLTADAPVIQMTDITNDLLGYDGDIKDYDGPVDHVYLPVSSPEVGNQIVAKMRTFADSCAH
jgi:hypothetical protein